MIRQILLALLITGGLAGCATAPPDLKSPCDYFATCCGQKWAINPV